MLFSPFQFFFPFIHFSLTLVGVEKGVGMKVYGNDPAIPLLCIHPEETRTERDTCTLVFTAALYKIVRTWKQPRCPSTDEWIRKLWYIYTMEYCSAIKRNAFQSVLMKWMSLEPIIPSNVRNSKKLFLMKLYVYLSLIAPF